LHTDEVILAGFALLRLKDLRTVELGSVDTRLCGYWNPGKFFYEKSIEKQKIAPQRVSESVVHHLHTLAISVELSNGAAAPTLTEYSRMMCDRADHIVVWVPSDRLIGCWKVVFLKNELLKKFFERSFL
jgi:hypothetical protein